MVKAKGQLIKNYQADYDNDPLEIGMSYIPFNFTVKFC